MIILKINYKNLLVLWVIKYIKKYNRINFKKLKDLLLNIQDKKSLKDQYMQPVHI